MKELTAKEVQAVAGGAERLTVQPGTTQTRGKNPFGPGPLPAGSTIPYVRYVKM